jgi:hypothetical protein
MVAQDLHILAVEAEQVGVTELTLMAKPGMTKMARVAWV